jgi:stearoyl-CoA desaturase (delta-9 desaturase)
METTLTNPSKNAHAVNRVVFILIHLVPLGALWTHVTAFDWAVCVALYVARMFFVTAGYHRYFSHRTFKTSRAFQAILAFCAQTSAQKGILWWAANHRIHHKHSDTDSDPHSKLKHGFWESHIGWILTSEHEATRYDLVKDLTKFPELVWLNKHYLFPAIALGAVVTFLGGFVNGGSFSTMLTHGWSTLFIGFFLSTIILYHATFAINSIMHWYGKPRYNTGDASKNSFILAILSLGEGWHNNHHYYQSSTRQGFFWWEIDITYYVLKVFSWFGLVWEIREVPEHVQYDPEKLLQATPAGKAA